MSKCKGCGAEIVWIQTENGKSMPCNAEKVTIVTADGKTVTGHIPHWATCAVAEKFRGKNGNKANEHF